MSFKTVIALSVLFVGCKPPPLPPLEDLPCDVANERVGARACVHAIADIEQWDSLSRLSTIIDRRANTKWLAAATPDSYVQDTLFLDMNTYTLHWEMLAAAFPDAFPGLTHAEYSRMVLDPVNREYFSGDLVEFVDREASYFGFTIWDDPSDVDAVLSEEEVHALYDDIASRMGIRPLFWVPNSNLQRQAAESWGDTDFPIRNLDDSLPYEAYTQGTGIGTVRLYDAQQFAQATEDAAFSYQDLLILDEAPFDVERPIAGAVTGTRQGDLSHLNVRSAGRGTPNCYVREPLDAFSEWEGQLVALTCGPRGYTVRPATPEEAETFWIELRPEPITLPAPNRAFADTVQLLDVSIRTATDRRGAVSTFGSKGTNLAHLYQLTDPSIQLTGFVVPFYWYIRFVETTSWTVDLGDGPADYTFQETLDAWHADDLFLTDATVRRDRLDDLRDAMRDATVDPVLEDILSTAITDVWDSDTVMVRFRSSSNAEDALTFNGAGLYDSTSVCLADTLDSDSDGPSHCDPDKDNERTVARGLRKVWASTWNVEAWEERDWYGITHDNVAMGVLVNTRSKDEQANIVAFTGNPSANDDRTLVNAQFGEWDVVSAEPGVAPEKTFVTVSASGEVTDIQRIRQSTVGSGIVLTNQQLTDLASALHRIEQQWPIDEPVPDGRSVLLDTEWKVLEDGRLIVKQVRPFLR